MHRYFLNLIGNNAQAAEGYHFLASTMKVIYEPEDLSPTSKSPGKPYSHHIGSLPTGEKLDPL
ncbi:unnamed protein product, partial [marine sediment metagenome]